MTMQAIEVEGLPEGYKVNTITVNAKENVSQCFNTVQATIHLKKIQPRRIVLEETSERNLAYNSFAETRPVMQNSEFVWREVNETAPVKMGVSQGDGETKLELSVKEVRNVRSLIKDFENLGWFINPERALLLQKITEFLKDK